MLKEELEKNIGFNVSGTLYSLANERYMNGNWRNNYEFCGELKQDKLLMRALYERDCALKALVDILTKLHKVSHDLNLQIR